MQNKRKAHQNTCNRIAAKFDTVKKLRHNGGSKHSGSDSDDDSFENEIESSSGNNTHILKPNILHLI